MADKRIEIERPGRDEYATFYQGYVEQLPEGDILETMADQLERVEMLRSLVDPSVEQYRYATGKWSIREVIGHLIDAERVFGHRAFCISRGDQTPLPGFDENDYVAASGNDERPLQSLIDELAALRRSTLLLFSNLPAGSERNVGNANGSPVSVRALAWIITGHVAHHFRVLQERYGVAGTK